MHKAGHRDDFDAILREWVEKYPRSYFKKVKASANREILEYVNALTPLLSDDKYLISTKIYWVLHGIEDFPRCVVCKNQLKQNVKVNEGYPTHCSAKCMSRDPEVQRKKEASYEAKYGEGVVNPFQAAEVIRKIDETNLRKYGARRFTQTKEFKNMISEDSAAINSKRCEHVYPGYLDVAASSEIVLPYNRNVLAREFEYYSAARCNDLPRGMSTRNEIVKYFQQDAFFRVEKEIWRSDPEKRKELVANRAKYLKKPPAELTPNDILCGFKRSGVHYGFSHFNPLWFRWFIERYGVKKCYDPTGGWGHRLLGGLGLEKYIYNDLSPTTKSNVDAIIRYFHIKNTVTYCEDARKFSPPDEFDAMFTCIPYWNLEKYECGGFQSKEDFKDFVDSLFSLFSKRGECKTFGIVAREDLLDGHDRWTERFELNSQGRNQYLSNTRRKFQEFMYVFKK